MSELRETRPPPCREVFHYLALYDLRSQPLGMAVAQVAGRDSNLLPEQAELELDQSRRRETGQTGGSHCGHGERSCGKKGFVCDVWMLVFDKNTQKKA